MLFYLSVAIGGAIGSIARAWLAIAAARITGPQFPWGTILINIIGSFVIGFFGTLTASDSRFAVSTDVRAFVMIGICGGFTTFSSFSLQTLELAHSGRIAQAVGNVGMSMVLCLLAVTAGYASGSSLYRPDREAALSGDDNAGSMMGVTLNMSQNAEIRLPPGCVCSKALVQTASAGIVRAS